MPYRYVVREELTLDEDGNATCTRTVAILNPSPLPTPLLRQDFREYFVDSASGFSVVDKTRGVALTFEEEDNVASRTVRWILPPLELPANGSHEIEIKYSRAFLAHSSAGYLNLSVGYRNKALTDYELAIVLANPIIATIVHKIVPPTASESQYTLTGTPPMRLVFPSRQVSMNRPFELHTSIQTYSKVAVPKLPVVDYVIEQIKIRAWFGKGKPT